jgi:hypothetical protein
VVSIVLAVLAMASMTATRVDAHCDTLDGPVVADARLALARGDVTPVLKWVKPDDEAAIREAFGQAMAVRPLGTEAQALADRYFFETLVRIHRAGEGAPFDGLKPAGSVAPPIAMADRALEQGSPDTLIKAIQAHTEEGIRERFGHALEARKHAAESVTAGRAWVEAYVTYVHYVEGVVGAVHAAPAHAAGAAVPAGHVH